MCTCKRCGEYLTKVYWHDGAAYGSTCIKAVAGSKHSIKAMQYVEVKALSVREPVREGMGYRVMFQINKGSKRAHAITDHGVTMGALHVGGSCWLVLDKFIPKGYEVAI